MFKRPFSICESTIRQIQQGEGLALVEALTGQCSAVKLSEDSLTALALQVRVPPVLGAVRCGRAAPGGVPRAGAGRLRGGDRGLQRGGRPLRRHHAHQVAAVCRY